jgi:hypothetical protein
MADLSLHISCNDWKSTFSFNQLGVDSVNHAPICNDNYDGSKPSFDYNPSKNNRQRK